MDTEPNKSIKYSDLDTCYVSYDNSWYMNCHNLDNTCIDGIGEMPHTEVKVEQQVKVVYVELFFIKVVKKAADKIIE